MNVVVCICVMACCCRHEKCPLSPYIDNGNQYDAFTQLLRTHLIIHFRTSLGVSKVSEQMSERSGARMSEQNRAREHASE